MSAPSRNAAQWDDDLLDSVKGALKEKGFSDAQITSLSKHIQEIFADVRGSKPATFEIAEMRALEALDSKLGSIAGLNAARDGGGVIEAANVYHHRNTPETFQTPYQTPASMTERMLRPEVLVNGGTAALFAYGAYNALMSAKTKDAEGKTHWRATPMMLGAIQAIVATAIASQAIKGWNR